MRTAIRVAAVVVTLMVLGGCAAEQARMAKRQRDFQAARLGAPSESVLRYLSTDERDALDRVGMGGRIRSEDSIDPPGSNADSEAVDADLDTADEEGLEGDTNADAAGKVGVSVLQIGLTLGMLAAPFFLF